NLERLLETKAFREDLYYRLNVVEIHLPTLGDRKEDIPPLTTHCISRLNRELGKNVERLSEEASQLLMRYDWPGNVRELENVVERAMVLGKSGVLGTENFPTQITRLRQSANAENGFFKNMELPENGLPLIETVEEMEKNLIKEALKRTGGNKTKAAHLLRVTRKIMRYKTDKYGLDSSKGELGAD
ncbi:MAG: sigma-54-dependent Fis family transcriptional regulator, partial [Candidatus Abyssubacteria bacterium]|nr:sigma-54-dependent Fis family transcriptional regulator [Candidatus Abyssubacteria bacterium]